MHEINPDKNSNIYKERRRYRGGRATTPTGGLELQKFPSEILINIFSYLDESDFFTLEKISTHFRDLINDEELWKKLFVSHYHTDNFPSFSKSTQFHIEYTKRREALSRWRHSRVVKTRYVISQAPILPAVTTATTAALLDTVQFDYPRCACFNDGTITLLQLQHKRSKQRLTYIPCSAPQGCSAMCFNLNSAVFGRFDGHVYGKLLSNKSYLDSVMQFDSSHFTAVTAIATAATGDTTIKYDWCVSGAESGEIIWWKEGKLVKSLKLSNLPVRRLYLHKDWTIAFTDAGQANGNTTNTIYVIYKLEHVRTIPIPFHGNNNTPLFVQVDFGSKLLVVANREEICVISFNQLSESFGSVRRFKVADHYPGNAQSDSPVHITNIFLDTETAHREQLVTLAGGDTCYMAALTSVDSVLLFDIRDPNEQLKVRHTINFEDRVFTLAVTNLIIVVALSGSIQILNLLDGSHLKTIQRTEKYPQILKFSKDKIIVGNTNILYFLDFIPNKLNKRNIYKGSSVSEDGTVQHGHHNRNAQANKWNELLASQLQLYNEEEDILERQQRENERLRRAYGGDSRIEEDVQLRIALLESSDAVAGSTNLSQEAIPADDAEEQEQLRRAIEESRLLHEAQEGHDQAHVETTGQDVAGDGSAGHTTTSTDALTEQEELELAIALSLSELNQ